VAGLINGYGYGLWAVQSNILPDITEATTPLPPPTTIPFYTAIILRMMFTPCHREKGSQI